MVIIHWPTFNVSEGGQKTLRSRSLEDALRKVEEIYNQPLHL